MRRPSLAFVALLALPACAHHAPPPVPPPPLPPPSTSSSLGTETTAPNAYSGHGAESIPAEVLARFRPAPLSRETSEHLQSLFDVRSTGRGILAPGGKTLYFGWAVTGIGQVWKSDGPGMFPRQLTGGQDSTQLAAVSPDGAWLVIARDRAGEENPGLYLQPAAGGPLIVVQHKAKVQTLFAHVSDDSKWIYYTANDVKPDSYAVYRYEIASHRSERLFDADGLWSVADHQPDGRLLLRKATGSLTAEFYELTPSTKVLTAVVGQSEGAEYEAAYGARAGEVIVATNKFGDLRRIYSFAEGTFTPLGDELRFDITDFSVDPGRRRVLYRVNEGGRQHGYALDAKSHARVGLPLPPEYDQLSFGDTTPDGRYTTLAIDEGRGPAQAFVLDWKARKLTPWAAPSTPEVDAARFARATAETFPARDGVAVPVLVRQSDACAKGSCPVVVSFHGGPEGQSMPGFNGSAQAWVDAGFTVVEPNVRGSLGYGKAWSHADDGPKRLAVITDIEDAALWARGRFTIGGRAPKVGVYGGSYGGYSVLMAMTMFAGAYDAGVDVVGISNLVTFLKNTAPYRRALRASEYGDLERDHEALVKLSPMTYVDRARSPLLILQGATDPRVPAGEAIQVYEALQKKGIDSALMIYPDEGHGAQKRENRVSMLGHAIAFMKKHLGG